MKTSKLGLLILTLPTLGVASTAPNPAVVAKAAAILAHSDEILATTQTIEAKYTQVDAYPGKFRDLRQEGTVSLEHPGEYRVAITRARRVEAGDPWKDTGNNTLEVSGHNGQFSVFFHPHSTQVRKADSPAPANLKDIPALNGFFQGGNTPGSILTKAASEGTLQEATVDGSQVEFTIGKIDRTIELGSDGLIHRLEVRNNETKETRTWTLDQVSLGKKISASRFDYQPPTDALPYSRGSADDGLEIGTKAPEFVVTDSSGNTIRLSDLRGKVVVLKFWATWCWPCNQSLPETEGLAAAYQSKDVETVAVSIKDSKVGFTAWLKKHPNYRHIRFAFEDPNQSTISSAYEVRTQPSVFVIGKDGAIRAEIDGFTGPNPALEKAIQAALAN